MTLTDDTISKARALDAAGIAHDKIAGVLGVEPGDIAEALAPPKSEPISTPSAAEPDYEALTRLWKCTVPEARHRWALGERPLRRSDGRREDGMIIYEHTAAAIDPRGPRRI